MSKRFMMKELRDSGDSRGGMCVVECGRDLPFTVQRFFYDFHTSGAEARGNHANRHSRFAFISLVGSCAVFVDDGENRERFILDDPHKLLYTDRMTWKVMDAFSPDNVLLILSDSHYDSEEYIRDYGEFLNLIKAENGG